MSEIPTELKYSQSHEWVRDEGDGTVTIGITEHAQALLGDMVFVELPDVDAEVHTGDEAGVVESVKAASDIYAPLSGTIVEVNELLADSPETVNTYPYGDGWIFRLQVKDQDEINSLLSATDYAEFLEEEA